ncbi:MAG: NUDIX hydrolase [SAR86 cluster bacterium]|uniref:Phosphatase NudJ n=1 Tax=SAR86 cluster bacterium TaxID=2030880 RepID=A0A2A5B4S5_9GAMM|nr:MAG: NUDIX hydrolase [SAR86 cluster bacterium]
MTELPHITVATIVEREGQFLMVKEMSDSQIVYNQPAGHLEKNETLLQAAERETLEETAWRVKPTHLLGIYQYTSPTNGISYVRHCFITEALEQVVDQALDTAIIETQWLSFSDLKARSDEMRSPLVLKVIADYLSGQRFPLSLLSNSD